jgi:hypothetical protein
MTQPAAEGGESLVPLAGRAGGIGLYCPIRHPRIGHGNRSHPAMAETSEDDGAFFRHIPKHGGEAYVRHSHERNTRSDRFG